MNTRNIYIKLVFGCLMLLLVACRKDQDFTYQDINEVVVTTAQTDFNVLQLQRLKIEPEIKETKPGGDTYTYEWKTYKSREDSFDILSTKKNLDTTIALVPGTYRLQYTITNTKTGLRTFKLLNLEVRGAFFQGWMVAHNKGSEATLSFIRTDGEFFMFPAKDINQKTYPGTALSSFYSTEGMILFFTTEGAFRFNPNDFVELVPNLPVVREAHFVKPAYAVAKFATEQYIADKAGLYIGIAQIIDPLGGSSLTQTFSDRVPGDYELFPAVIASAQGNNFFYDNKNKRFLQAGVLARAVTVVPNNTSQTASFNPASVGKTMIAHDKGRIALAGDVDYFVMEDAQGRYLYSMTYSGASIVPGFNQAINYSQSPDFAIATSFATSSLVQQMYYAANNKIYLYNMLNNSAELIYQFPAGYQVKDIEMLRSTSKRLVVGVDHGSEGEVYYFDINGLGSFENSTYVNKYTGFGNIAHLSFR